jgi:hypothetical protein
MNAQDTSDCVLPCCRNDNQTGSDATKQCTPTTCFQLLLRVVTQRQAADTQMSREEANLQVGG